MSNYIPELPTELRVLADRINEIESRYWIGIDWRSDERMFKLVDVTIAAPALEGQHSV